MLPEKLPNGDFGFRFYGALHRFEVGLTVPFSWADAPPGLIGTGGDLTGRMNSRCGHDEVSLATGVRVGVPLTFPYLMLTASGFCEEGDDLIIRLLALISKDYGLLATTTLYAGRDREDCCSPEIYYRLEKVALGAACPLDMPTDADFLDGCQLAEWSFATNLGGGRHLIVQHDEGAYLVAVQLAAAYRTFRQA